MPLMDKIFKRRQEECLTLLKCLQLSTRVLQQTCLFTKVVTADTGLSRHIPSLKKELEFFIYRVKSMLAVNDAVSIFSIGMESCLSHKKMNQESLNAVYDFQGDNDIQYAIVKSL